MPPLRFGTAISLPTGIPATVKVCSRVSIRLNPDEDSRGGEHLPHGHGAQAASWTGLRRSRLSIQSALQWSDILAAARPLLWRASMINASPWPVQTTPDVLALNLITSICRNLNICLTLLGHFRIGSRRTTSST